MSKSNDNNIISCKHVLPHKVNNETLKFRFSHYTDDPKNSNSDFKRRVTISENIHALKLLCAINMAFHNASIEWMLFYGSLAGQVFFHGIIPWDDDWDIIAIATEEEVKSAIEIFIKRNNKYCFAQYDSSMAKIYSKDCRRAGDKSWNWPFIDIFYSKINQNSRKLVIDYTNKSYDLDDIFPIKMGFFHGILLPIPKNPQKILDITYSKEFGVTCMIGFDHKNEQFGSKIKINCKELREIYAWVKTITLNKGNKNEIEIQYLKRKNKIYYYLIVRHIDKSQIFEYCE